eukprot:CAMPEP_0194277166 /NCGR_PEP_ID=MMETSP0169-20130528/9556_1 /TAXON_ID=218684 /ORGANISM="Corethron pennatum, Strain L29A3" /LENGTH=487 /DNA_ID=CAMNT_0039021061 /DNA_START=40 /DNA_END=1503 /DNA_ORIENTATION=+
MDLAFQNFTELLAVFEAERGKLARKERNLEEYHRQLNFETAKGRRALEKDRATLEAEIARVEGMVVRPEDWVRLNIGGQPFETTRRTLTAAMDVAPASYLGAMFSGRHEVRMQRDTEGRVYIDRDGFMFTYILNFLRRYSSGNENAAFEILALPETQRKVMREELEYYGLERAVFPPVSFSINVAIFSPGPEMLSERSGLGAVVLPENQGVLIIGGGDNDDNLASTEILDLETERFSPGPSMESERWCCGAAVLEDGSVVAIGGYNETSLSTTEVFYPGSTTWSPGPNLASARLGCTALPLTHNRVLVIGGQHDSSDRPYLSPTELVDLTSGISTPGPEMSRSRHCCSAVMLHDGRVLIIGGRSTQNTSLSTTEVLDFFSGTSSPGPELNTARRGTSAVLLPEDGGVLVIGGKDNHGTELSTTEVLDVAGNTTSSGPKLCIPRSFCTAVKLPGDRIIVIGGYSDGYTESSCEILGMPAEEGQQQLDL